MNTLDFFNLVLPEVGYTALAVPGNSGELQHFFRLDNAEAASLSKSLDDRGRSIYFACATFIDGTSSFKGGGGRKQSNVAAVRSFWLDIDVEADKPKKYPTKRDAMLALVTFVRQVGLPDPLVVSSGGGLHVYWPMLEDMDPATWKATATLLKRACFQFPLLADPTRTADSASILRPPGTTHRKGAPKPVKVVQPAGATDHAAFRAALVAYVGEEPIEDVLAARPSHAGPVVNQDLSGGIEYPAAFAHRIANRCGVIGLLRDTQGNVDQPTWFHGLGVLAFTEEGDAVCHEWSAGHPAYSPAETDAKIAQVRKFKPTTCAKLGDFQPDICKGCPHLGKIVSPISLGWEPTPIPVTAAPLPDLALGSPQPAPGPAAPQAPSAPAPMQVVDFPRGYMWSQMARGGYALHVETPGGDDGPQWMPFCDTLFYPVNRIFDGDGYAMEIEMEVRPGQHRRFMLQSSTVAEGGKNLFSELGRHEVVALGRMKPQIEPYLSAWMDKLRKQADEVGTHSCFGWSDKNFVVGNRMITPQGDKIVLLRNVAAQKGAAFTPTGSLEEWKAVVNTAYNYEGQEAFQYLVMLSFAAPLFAMFKQYGGITVYAHSEGSGVGKTTAQRVGLSAWGSWADLQLAEGKTTVNALWALIGAYHNLPVLFDELTNQQNSVASDVVFSVSSGRAKERLSSDGSLRTNTANWSTIVMASGNNLLSEKLSIHRANAEAELARLFEFTVRNTSRLTPNEAAELFPKVAQNYGHAGLEFMRYVVANYDKVEQVLHHVQKAFNDKAGITQVERYWSALQASVLTALHITRKLGLVGFDPAAMEAWMLQRVRDNRANTGQSVSVPTEQFGKMLADLWQGVLVTEGEGDVRRGAAAVVLQDPRGQMVGRSILPVVSDPNSRAVLILNTSSVKAWCNKQGVSMREMEEAITRAGWLEDTTRYSLGRGTAKYASVTSQVRCWVIDPVKMGSDAGAAGQVAQKLKIVGG